MSENVDVTKITSTSIDDVTEDTLLENIKETASKTFTEEISETLNKYVTKLEEVCNAPPQKSVEYCYKVRYLNMIVTHKSKPEKYSVKILVPNKFTEFIKLREEDTSPRPLGGPHLGGPPVKDNLNTPDANQVVETSVVENKTKSAEPPVDTSVVEDANSIVTPVVESAETQGANPVVTQVANPISTPLDPLKVILSYENGKYTVQDKEGSNFHILERKDITQCFAYKSSPSAPEDQTQNSNGFFSSITSKFKSIKNGYKQLDEQKGGKRRTKKHRVTKKLNQKRRGFKSRSNK